MLNPDQLAPGRNENVPFIVSLEHIGALTLCLVGARAEGEDQKANPKQPSHPDTVLVPLGRQSTAAAAS